MGTSKATNLKPEVLEHAYRELGQLATLLEVSPALKRLSEASSVSGDLSGLDDSAGGWSWLEGHVSDIAGYVSGVTTAIHTETALLQGKMRDSIDKLSGTDDSNSQGYRKSADQINSDGTAH